ADLIDIFPWFLEDVIDSLAEADDRMVQSAGRLLVGVHVQLQLAGDAIEFLEYGALVVLHAGRLIEQPDNREFVIFEMAKNLASKLIERDADLLDVEEGITGDFTAAAQVSGGDGGEQVQGGTGQGVDLDVGQA